MPLSSHVFFSSLLFLLCFVCVLKLSWSLLCPVKFFTLSPSLILTTIMNQCHLQLGFNIQSLSLLLLSHSTFLHCGVFFIVLCDLNIDIYICRHYSNIIYRHEQNKDLSLCLCYIKHNKN